MIPLQNKSADETLKAFKTLLRQAKTYPETVLSDRGSEIKNAKFRAFCDSKNIKLFHSDTSIHCAFVERVIGTLKVIIEKYLTENNTYSYIDVLPELVQTYNNRKHSVIGLTPKEAEKEINHQKIREDNHKRWSKIKVKDPIYKVNQLVRISKQKDKFFRKFYTQMNEEIFRIKRISTHLLKPLYTLESFDSEETIEGDFYQFELLPVQLTDKSFKVEKILEKKKRKGEIWVLIKWYGYKNPTWAKESDIIKL